MRIARAIGADLMSIRNPARADEESAPMITERAFCRRRRE